MFLSLLRRRNPDFLRAIAYLHRTGALPPNCYALDLDAIRANAAAIKTEADRLNLRLFAMTKQIGRNPDVSRALVETGIDHAVGVDLQCAVAAAAGGMKVGHLGHLVQIARGDARTAAQLMPEYWTVFSGDKAVEAGQATLALQQRSQALLARVYAPGDVFYSGHEGGFNAAEMVRVADELDATPGAHFGGITTFPAVLFKAELGRITPTQNLATLERLANVLGDSGRASFEVNAPGTTSAASLPLLAEAGATQAEPGHGLTGTTPWHAAQDLIEDPAVAYVSEVSHEHAGSAYAIGGGLYVDPVLAEMGTQAVIVTSTHDDPSVAPTLRVNMPSPNAIDYYAPIPLGERTDVRTGDTVIFGFRPQAFVTRALTAAISGIRENAPRVEGIWAADGSAVQTIGAPA